MFLDAIDRFRAFVRGKGGSRERHLTGGGTLREVVFGANDGLVSNVALVAGVAGGTTDGGVILLGGIAGAVAGAISMALGAYISTKSEREFRDSEEARERWEVEHMREEELAETRHIFRLKGITGPLLDEVVAAVSRDHDQWVKLMMTEELGFAEEAPKPGVDAVVMGISFAIAAAFPVAPYLFLEGTAALLASLGFTGVALFLVAGWRAYLTRGAILKKSLEMVVLAGIAVAVANGIGRLVGINL
ncbi:MAG: VIT1/CCC1 transporter family protein [Dehalococcoidia bacterium]